MKNKDSINTSNRDKRSKTKRRVGAATLSCAVLFGMLAVSTSSSAFAAESRVGLGTAETYSVLAGQTVTNTGSSVLANNLGTSPGTAITGFPPGIVGGMTHAADENSSLAQSDLVKAYDDAASRQPTEIVEGDLVGRTLVSGVYKANSSLELNGTVTLDAQGDPNAVWIFQVGSELKTGSSSSVSLVNGASACNIYWQVGSSATLGTDSDFKGSIMALTSITVTTDATVEGRALARNGAVTLDNNVFTEPNCAAQIPEDEETPVPVPTPSDTPTDAPTDAPTDSPSPAPSDEPTTSPTEPTETPSDAPTTVPSDDATTPSDDETVGSAPVDSDSNNGITPGVNDGIVIDEDVTSSTYDSESNVSGNQEEELARTGASSSVLYASIAAALALAGGLLLFLNSRTSPAVRKN